MRHQSPGCKSLYQCIPRACHPALGKWSREWSGGEGGSAGGAGSEVVPQGWCGTPWDTGESSGSSQEATLLELLGSGETGEGGKSRKGLLALARCKDAWSHCNASESWEVHRQGGWAEGGGQWNFILAVLSETHTDKVRRWGGEEGCPVLGK